MRPDLRFGPAAALLAAALLVGAPPALAQSASKSTGDKSAAEEVMDDRNAEYSLRELLGVAVQSPRGEKLGTLQDVIYARAGEDLTAIVSVGGVMGVGDKLVAEPFSQIDISGESRVVMNASPEELESRPAFSYDELNKPFAAEQIDGARRADYLEAWTSRMDDWAERVDQHASEMNRTARDQVQAGWEEAQARWEEVKESSEDDWERAERAFEDAFATFQDTWKTNGGAD